MDHTMSPTESRRSRLLTERKERNNGSLHLKTVIRSLLAGRRFFPRELVTTRGTKLESKKSLRRVAFSTISRGGSPRTSMMHANCSVSCSPRRKKSAAHSQKTALPMRAEGCHTWKQWIAHIQLRKNASKAPHVDVCGIRQAKKDLRGSIESRLDVRVHSLVLKARRAEVYYFDSGSLRGFQENVLRLQVTVNDSLTLQEIQRHENLSGESTN